MTCDRTSAPGCRVLRMTRRSETLPGRHVIVHRCQVWSRAHTQHIVNDCRHRATQALSDDGVCQLPQLVGFVGKNGC